MTNNQILLSVVMLILIIICIQDFKYRAISWFLFPILGVSVILFNNKSMATFNLNLLEYIINIGLVIFQLIIITLFFAVKSRKIKNIIDIKIGLGDILMFGILALSFSMLNFVLFFTLTLILSLGFHLLLSALKIIKDSRVPLASYISIFYGLTLVLFYINDSSPMVNIINLK